MSEKIHQIVLDEGVLCMFSECKHCSIGNRSKIIISHTKSDKLRNHLIKTVCMGCGNEAIVKLTDVSREEGDND